VKHVVFMGAIDDGPTMAGVSEDFMLAAQGGCLSSRNGLCPTPLTFKVDVVHLLLPHRLCLVHYLNLCRS
jgi:hypothetical protein